MGPGLGSDDLLLDGCQQQLGFGQGQAKIADLPEIIGPHDLHHIGALALPISSRLYQLQNPSHPPPPKRE
jgi:hypothetical protein